MFEKGRIDLNSDVGESFGSWSFGDDAEILESVSSANIACGFHGGDPLGIRSTAQQAVAVGATIGAHIGYRDLAGFGRRFIDYNPAELAAEVTYQLGALNGIAHVLGTRVQYVKPHGALGHAMRTHTAQARAVVDAVAEFDPKLTLLLLPNSVAVDLARESEVRSVIEVFADRGYTAEGNLIPRGEPGALIHDLPEIIDNMLRLVEDGTIIAQDGTETHLQAESICVHGDTEGAIEIARGVRRALEDQGIEIRSFV